MEKDTFQEYIDGLQNSNITMDSVMNQLIKRKQQQQERKNFQERLQEKDEISRMSKSILSNSNSTASANASPKHKTFMNRLSFKVQNISQKFQLPPKILSESPNENQSPNFEESPNNRRSMFAEFQRQGTMQSPKVASVGRQLKSQKTMELKPISRFFSKAGQQSLAPTPAALQKLIFKQPIKKEVRQKDNESDSNSDEYLDDVGDLGIAKINGNFFKRRMNSVRNDAIILQSQLGPYLEQVKHIANELATQLELIIDLYKNEQRVIAAISEIIAEFQQIQKCGMCLASVFTLKDIFFQQDQKKFKASSINLITIANHIAKQKVRQYDQDNNLLPPKVNIEVLKALEDITKQLKTLIYQKKVLNLKAVEQESKQSINSFKQLKTSYFNQKDPMKQEELEEMFKEYSHVRTIIGPEYFDLQERKINENMENMIGNIKGELYESEVLSKFERKQRKKDKEKSNSSSDSSEEEQNDG